MLLLPLPLLFLLLLSAPTIVVALISPSAGFHVTIYPGIDDVSSAVVQDVVNHANEAIAARKKFCLAVPGGSVLKMLAQLNKFATATDYSRWHLFYANHKCVPLNDPSSTHFKAQGLFLNNLPALNAYPISESADVAASAYAAAIKEVVPLLDGLPVFDYMLLGMGKDGHIGSLYPGRSEVLQAGPEPWVLRVDKKAPASVTLSLPVMNAAREVRLLECLP